MIADALDTPDPREELKKAVQHIIDYCQKSSSTPSFIQFGRFIGEITSLWEMRQKMPSEMVSSIAADLALELSFGLFDGSEWEAQAAKRLIESQKSIRDFHVHSLADRPDSLEEHRLELIVKRDGIPIGSWQLRQSVQSVILPRIMPGTYTFGLSTGRRLLLMELTDVDLLWSQAFPDQDLPVAADIGDANFVPSQISHLWDEKLVVQVFPGIESGRIVINIKDLC